MQEFAVSTDHQLGDLNFMYRNEIIFSKHLHDVMLFLGKKYLVNILKGELIMENDCMTDKSLFA